MKQQKTLTMYLSLCLSLILLTFNTYSIGIYDNNGEFTYYVSNTEPIIEINITAANDMLKIDKGTLTINQQDSIFDIDSSVKFLNPFSSKNYIFETNKVILSTDIASFKLNVVKSSTDSPITPFGDPIDFLIKTDNILPQLLNFQIDIQNKEYSIQFDEDISLVKIYVNNILVKEYNNIKNGKIILNNQITIPIDDFDFNDETSNSFKVEYYDLALNLNTYEENIYLSQEPFTMKLITLRDDSNLKYNYNSNYTNLFDKKIYTNTKIFTLKITTNKKAKCAFSSSVSSAGLPEWNEVNDKQYFSTTDDLTHTISINSDMDIDVWIACQNIYQEYEILYLSKELGVPNNLLKIEYYNTEPISILTTEPTSLITNNPFDIFTTTSSKSVCFYSLDNQNEIQLSTIDFILHSKKSVSSTSGTHSLDIRCIDVLNNIDIKENTINIDETQGVTVTSYSPKYSMTNAATIYFYLSEYMGVECKYLLNEVKSSSFFDTFILTNLNNISQEGTLSVSQLQPGKNNISIYCKKEPNIKKNTIEIIYDNNGITISDFTFVNGDYESNYVGSKSKISFSANVTSLIPIDKYIVKVEMPNNKSIEKEVSSATSSISGDFNNATKLILTITNEFGFNKTIEKNIKFDLTPPQISFTKVTSRSKKITCVDIESDCAEVFYGTSQTSIDCIANMKYNNSIIDPLSKNYICAKGFNFVNLETYDITDVTNEDTQDSTGSSTSSNSTSPTEDNNTTTIDNNNDDNSNDDPWDSTPPIEEDNTTTYLLIAAIIFVIAGVGGGGYYAYSKGYLNNEIKKLGLKIHLKNTNNEKNNTMQNNIGAKFTTSNTKRPNNEVTNQKKVRKSNYDNHLDKLNKYIDDSAKKDTKMFSKFNVNVPKGKVKEYEDTLIKRKTKKKDITKEEFDEFYDKYEGTEKTILNTNQNLQKEAENFEDYYKNKKNESKEDKNKTNNKNTKDKKK